jgi:aminoglycoside phosphotransferase (APT) family kinase protein
MLTHGGDRVVILPFAGDGARPAAVLKVPRLPGFNGRTENEHETLRTLRSRLDPLLRDSVPRPLGTLRHGEITVGIESYAPGELLFRSMERWGTSRQQRLDDLTLAGAWLAEFHFQSQVSRTPWGEAEVSQWVEGPFDAYRRAFGSTEQERRLFADAREYAGSLDGTPLPIVLQHRDFTVWNIARSGRALAVFDWEGCRPGPALCDLLHFVTHWYEAVHHAHHEAARQHSFRRLFFEPDRRETFSEAAHRAVAQYMQRLDIGRRLLPLLLVYTWVELALRRFDQQRLQEETASAPREGNRYLGIVAILADGRQRLFGREPLRASQPRPA